LDLQLSQGSVATYTPGEADVFYYSGARIL